MMKKLDKFEIIEKVGQGAMGVVYKGRDPGIGRIVALKTLTSGLSEDPNLLRRFYTEAQSAGGLQHPNIVTIYELGQEGNTPFIAMQFINGESLDKIIDRRPRLPLSQKIGYIVYVCRALEYAHKQNPPVVHRDIKPGNVMVTTEGNVVVVDFGIARLGEGTRSQSAGLLIGTLGYMSPQLFRNKAADARSDIWATGVMFYELLAYRRPFEGDNAAALMSNIILEKPRSLSEAALGTPADVQAVVDRMLAKEVEARYQTMEEVLFDLEPLWRRLQQTDVYQLLEDSKQLFESGELESAKAGASQILKIDPTNASAKTLLEKINNEIRLRDLVPRLEASVASAKRLLQNGKVEEAKREVDAALQLDSRFLPARELRAQVEAEEERKRAITQRLGASKQSMAEGALTEAQLHLDKVLELDPGNAAALEQLRRIKEERSRRERRKQRDEALHRARTLWTNLQYEECIKLLVEALKQFPNDAEFSKLLESARQDQAEQQRQSLLAEARNLLSSQRFDDAVRTLDRLLERFPNDLTAKNLRTHAVQGRDQQIREQRLSEAKAKLRSWVKQVRYEDVIKHATPLSREFPDDFELTELIDFARTELSHLEQNRRLEQLSKQIQQALKEARFSEAIALSEKALREFPKNADFQMLLDRGKREQTEKEKSRKLEQSIREVERLIGREDLTGAIELTRQTISALGRDSRLLNTLHELEKEFEFREKKQDETLQQAQTLVGHGKITDATSILNVALDTKLFSRDDPRITQLLNEIDARKEPPSAAAAAAGAAAASSTFPGSPISSKPSSDPGKDYVYQRGTPLPDDLLSRGPEAVVSASSPTLITGSPQLAPPPAPIVQPPAPEKGKEKKRRPEEQRHTGGPGTIKETVYPLERTSTDLPSSTAEVRQSYVSPAEIFEPQVEPKPQPQPIPRPLWKNPLVLGGIGAALVGLGTTSYFLRSKPQVKQPTQVLRVQDPQPPSKEPPPPTNNTTRELFNQAEGYFGQKDWARAKSLFQKVTQDPEADTSLRTSATQRMEDAQRHLDELSKLKDASTALNQNDKQRAKSLYQQVVDMHLDHEREAQNMIQQIETGNARELQVAQLQAQIGTFIQSHDFLGARQRLPDLVAQGGDPSGELSRQIDNAENQWFGQLRNELQQAETSSDENRIDQLRSEFQKIASSNGPSAGSAANIAGNEIPRAIGDIRNRKALEVKWTGVVNKSNSALQSKNHDALTSAKNDLEPFRSGPHAAEAQNYIGQIDAALAPPPPPPPVDPKKAAETEITQLFAALSNAFGKKDINTIKTTIWPSMPKDKVEKLSNSFHSFKTVSRSYTVNDIKIDGETAKVTGTYSGIFSNGKEPAASGAFGASLGKQNNRWVILDLY